MKLIVAADDAGGIGKDGGIPWYIAEDFKRFKALTTGSTVVMGRKTWESLPASSRPLARRNNVVITSRGEGVFADPRFPKRGAAAFVCAHASLAEFVSRHQDMTKSAWLIGGAQIYAEAMREGAVKVSPYRELSEIRPRAEAGESK